MLHARTINLQTNSIELHTNSNFQHIRILRQQSRTYYTPLVLRLLEVRIRKQEKHLAELSKKYEEHTLAS